MTEANPNGTKHSANLAGLDRRYYIILLPFLDFAQSKMVAFTTFPSLHVASMCHRIHSAPHNFLQNFVTTELIYSWLFRTSQNRAKGFHLSSIFEYSSDVPAHARDPKEIENCISLPHMGIVIHCFTWTNQQLINFCLLLRTLASESSWHRILNQTILLLFLKIGYYSSQQAKSDTKKENPLQARRYNNVFIVITFAS